MAGLQSVQPQNRIHFIHGTGGIGPPLGFHGIHADRRREGREALVQPEIRPPLHGDQVTEPLVG